jgi:hypothetical protein
MIVACVFLFSLAVVLGNPADVESTQSTERRSTWLARDRLFEFEIRAEDNCAKAAEGALIARLPAGASIVWRRALINNPAVAFVDDGGRWVVTVGNRCSSSQAHAVTVYDAAGHMVRDLGLGDVLLADEVSRVRTEPDSGSRALFRVGGRIEFEDAGPSLVLPWGRRARVLR